MQKMRMIAQSLLKIGGFSIWVSRRLNIDFNQNDDTVDTGKTGFVASFDSSIVFAFVICTRKRKTQGTLMIVWSK